MYYPGIVKICHWNRNDKNFTDKWTLYKRLFTNVDKIPSKYEWLSPDQSSLTWTHANQFNVFQYPLSSKSPWPFQKYIYVIHSSQLDFCQEIPLVYALTFLIGGLIKRNTNYSLEICLIWFSIKLCSLLMTTSWCSGSTPKKTLFVRS